MARIFPVLGIDVEDVLDAAATKWNFHRYRPGVGVGGHCIPVDPYYLTYKAQELGYVPEVILSGRKLNDSMGGYVADKVGVDMYDILPQDGKKHVSRVSIGKANDVKQLAVDGQVGDNTWIGPSSIISNSVKIGKKCYVTIGSLVLKSVKNNQIAFGYPAFTGKTNSSISSSTTSSGKLKL